MPIKKIITFILVIVLILVIVILVIGAISQRPISKAAAIQHLHEYFKKAAKPAEDFSGVQVLVYSETYGIDEQFAYGQASHTENQRLDPNQPFHVASVGKIFTATLIQMLAEEEKLTIQDQVAKYLDVEVLEGLFVYEGVDYKEEVTIEQLMDHTSGVADYFEDPVLTGETAADMIFSQPDKLWLPMDFINFTRDGQRAIGKPGTTYHYSDTGYILLGLIIEALEEKQFHEVLQDRIFSPLNMNDSYMALRGEPQNGSGEPIADVWFRGVEASTFKSLSIDWAGGGVISTPKDLLAFQKAFYTGELITETSLSQMLTIENQFGQGIYYGLGAMEIRFEEFFFLLKGLPRVTGHIGILSTHLFYDAETETYIVMNFGSDAKMVDSFKALIEILNTLKRIK